MRVRPEWAWIILVGGCVQAPDTGLFDGNSGGPPETQTVCDEFAPSCGGIDIPCQDRSDCCDVTPGSDCLTHWRCSGCCDNGNITGNRCVWYP